MMASGSSPARQREWQYRRPERGAAHDLVEFIDDPAALLQCRQMNGAPIATFAARSDEEQGDPEQVLQRARTHQHEGNRR